MRSGEIECEVEDLCLEHQVSGGEFNVAHMSGLSNIACGQRKSVSFIISAGYSA